MNALPRLPEFDYFKPVTVSEACQLLIKYAEQAHPFLGGTDLFVQMRDRLREPRYLIDLKGLPEVNNISYDHEKGLTIGAAVNMNRVISHPAVQDHYPILAEAAQSVASFQLRTRATIVGNICNASPAGDTIGACLLLNGVLDINGQDGVRQESLMNFFLGPGMTTLKRGEIVTAIRFPQPPRGLVGKYIKLGRNKLSDLALVGVTAIGYPDSDRASGYCLKIALASVAPTPIMADQVEMILSEAPLSEEKLALAAEAAMATCKPIDDVRASAHYRKHMVRNLSRRALKDVWNNLKH